MNSVSVPNGEQYATGLDLPRVVHVLALARSKSHNPIYARIFGEHSAPTGTIDPQPRRAPKTGGGFDLKRDEIAARQLHALKQHYTGKLRLAGRELVRLRPNQKASAGPNSPRRVSIGTICSRFRAIGRQM
jgi:hypothetical protein